MKIVTILLLSGFLAANASGFAQRVTLSANNVKLVKVFKEIKKQTGYVFFYDTRVLQEAKPVSINVKNETVGEVLKEILHGQPLDFSILRKTIIIVQKGNHYLAGNPDNILGQIEESIPLMPVNIINGTVKDTQGNPLAGVSVIVKGTQKGTSTSADGSFSIDANVGDVLEFTIVGYQKKSVIVRQGRSLILVMEIAQSIDDEIVVVGYGTQRKSDLTGAIVSIKGDEIKNLPVRSVAEALQGRAAGVTVNKSSGKPGSSSQIIIRGPGSINGLNPLFVIDGVPMSNTTNFDPKDVESIEIIKDASAAAIYGAQAAGGVVLVTTKKGSLNQKTKIDYSSNVGVREISKTYKMLETPDYIRARKGIGENYGLWNNPDIPNTNWFDELFQSGIEQSHYLSMSGGTSKTNYFLSGGYEREDGIQIGNFWERYSLRLNADYHLGKKITIGHQIYMAKISQNSATRDIPWRTLPYMAVYNEDGSFASVPSEVEFSGTNELGTLKYTHRKEGNLLLNGILYANLQIIDGLNLRVTGSGNFGGSFYDNFVERNELARTSTAESYNKISGYNESYVLNGVLTYSKTFANKHNLTAMAGYEARKSFNSSLNSLATGFPVRIAESFALSTNPDKISSGSLTYGRLLSQFGRIHYSFDNKYLFTANIRRDGSPKFGSENRWGVFPSLAIGWKLDQESFFKNLNHNIFTQIKPRASWGILGSDAAIGNFAYTPSYQVVGQHSFDETNIIGGFNSIKVVNKNIKWEQIETLNIGLDLGLFNNRLFFTADYYSRQTNGMLYSLPTPQSSGIAAYNSNTSTMPVNIGKISNKGWELSTSYRDAIGKFKFNISGNISGNINKVVNLGLPLAYTYSGSLLYMKGNSPFKTVNGQPIGMIYGLITEGLISSKEEIDKLNSVATEKAVESGSIQAGEKAYYNNINTGIGDLKFKDLNGDGKITDADRTFIGNPWPKLQYGLTMDVSWKGFDGSLMIVGVTQRDVINGSKLFEQSFYQDYQSTYDIFNASFFLGNGLTSQPRLGVANPANPASFIKDPSNNYTWYSSYFVENGAYLKIKHISIGYTLPAHLLTHIGLKKVRFFATGQNLFTFSKFSGLDPEFSNDVKNYGLYGINTYPQTKFYSGGIEISF